MKLGYYIKKAALREDARVLELLATLRADGHELYEVRSSADLVPGMEMLLSLGGDGTFLCASRYVAETEIPVLGVQLGRLGFLSENSPAAAVAALRSGCFSIEEREMLEARVEGAGDICPYALNEVSLLRASAAMIGVDVQVNGLQLPTYWADGLLVSTASGSTAYNLSAGGPICLPETRVLMVVPVAPHNLNLRPLVIPGDSRVSLSLHARDGKAVLSLDNRSHEVGDDVRVEVCAAPFPLRRVRLGKSNFIDALRDRLFWGKDVRNTSDL
ncbi:MAG: NAD(+)/NADH kinase [Bacteroidales bacterium]|nr:NAD(+)/NADH kinase [Bacteroidales bacterium]